MQPHASRASSGTPGSNNTPHRAKALPPLPPIETTSPRSPVSGAYSPPIRRKPLPPSAFSPPPISPPSLPQTGSTSERAVPPSSASRLNQLQEVAPQVHFEVQAPTSNSPQSYDCSTSPVDTSIGVSFNNLPVSSTGESQQPPVLPNEEPELQLTSEDMVLRPGERPPPLRMDSINSIKSLDVRKPSSPGSKFTSFFIRKSAPSPGAESNATDFSEGRSPLPSPYAPSDHSSIGSGINSYFNMKKHSSSQASQDSIEYQQPVQVVPRSSADARYSALEAELKEISVELANSIRRELDLEDLLERLQPENLDPGISADRTSDYFSDSGTSPLRAATSEVGTKEELDKIKRDSEQQRAQLKLDLSQKWQEEAAQRRTLEASIHTLEEKLAHSRRSPGQFGDSVSKTKELEIAFDDTRRRLQEERRAKENFEDLITALRVELEEHRSERDNLRDEVVPSLRTHLERLKADLADSQKTSHNVTKLQQEAQQLRDENAALLSARELEHGMNSQPSMEFIAEEDDLVISPRASMAPATPKIGGLARSNTITSNRGNRGSLAHSVSLTRSNSTMNRAQPVESVENVAEKVRSVEQQRDALHTTVKYLLRRQDQQRKQFSKRTRMLEAELERANASGPIPHKGGYEREVRVLRSEINTLRKRADDALDQKWQCEKNLAGLKMDLDRNKQETASLQRILQAKGSDPDMQVLMSTSLEAAVVELRKERVRTQENVAKVEQEEQLSSQLEEYAIRSEALSAQVEKQLQSNNALRARLRNAVESGEANQQASTEQINALQIKLRKLEDSISSAQVQSETAVIKHEDEVRVLKASHNAQLMRSISTSKRSTLNVLTPTISSPLSPLFTNSKKSPRIDHTTSGPSMALHEALRTEYLEHKVTDLERALGETEVEIGKIVGKMNQAQVNVADLEAERDEALRMTRRLENEVQAERQRYAELIKTLNEW